MTGTAPRLTVVQEIATLRQRLTQLREQSRQIALVPTMGALHDGHLSLVELAAQRSRNVVVSIFVNPLQFGAGEDLDRYPRTLDEDVAKLEALADELGLENLIVFAPSGSEMYPTAEPQTTVRGGMVSTMFEGAARPGHFDGMLTVVLKLLNIVEPDVAIFGQKDAQQLFLIRQMVRDLNLQGDIVGAPIVREGDGLALSSRNRYLTDADRQLALTLSGALQAVANSDAGTASGKLEAGLELLASTADIKLDYWAAVNPSTFTPIADDYRGSAIVIVAAKVGQTRLIDNLEIEL